MLWSCPIVGKDEWPLPIPLVKNAAGWRFDTKQGKEEILNRRIGRNELSTMQALLASVDAQREYYQRNPQRDKLAQYAQKVVSTQGKRDGLAQLRAEVVAMRGKISDAHPDTSGKFDVKHDYGGLIDVEFIVQYLVLGYSDRHAELTGNIGNLALLRLAARLELIAADQAFAAHDAYRRFRQLQHALRLQGDKYARVEAATLAAEISAVKKLWDSVLDATRR